MQELVVSHSVANHSRHVKCLHLLGPVLEGPDAAVEKLDVFSVLTTLRMKVPDSTGRKQGTQQGPPDSPVPVASGCCLRAT